MTHILMLLSSPRGQASLSTKVASALADRLTSEPGATLKIRDLAAEALPHFVVALNIVVGREGVGQDESEDEGDHRSDQNRPQQNRGPFPQYSIFVLFRHP